MENKSNQVEFHSADCWKNLIKKDGKVIVEKMEPIPLMTITRSLEILNEIDKRVSDKRGSLNLYLKKRKSVVDNLVNRGYKEIEPDFGLENVLDQILTLDFDIIKEAYNRKFQQIKQQVIYE